MKIAITALGKTLDDEIDQRFGRAQFFLIVNTDDNSFEVLENAQCLNLPQGAGIQAAQNVANENVEAVITGNCGPKAFQTLNAAGIKVYTGGTGKIKDVITSFNEGKLSEASAPNVRGHQ